MPNPRPVTEGRSDPPGPPDHQLPRAVARLTAAIDRLTDVIEQHGSPLGDDSDPRYTSSHLVDEATMADRLDISRRTLAHHRLHNRLPACWIKNGRRIMWHVEATIDAWQRGIT